MVKLQFPDGSSREYEEGKTLLEVAESISISLKKKCIAAKLNDELVTRVKNGHKLKFNIDDDEVLIVDKNDDIIAIYEKDGPIYKSKRGLF